MQTAYYTSMSEELFIEKNINWLRLRDVTLKYDAARAHSARNASVFVTATDVFLWTNYTGLDPIANGNDAAVGGSGGVGIDYGELPDSARHQLRLANWASDMDTPHDYDAIHDGPRSSSAL